MFFFLYSTKNIENIIYIYSELLRKIILELNNLKYFKISLHELSKLVENTNKNEQSIFYQVLRTKIGH